MLRLNKTFNSFNVIGDQWTPYTYTKNRKEEWSQSRIFLFDLSSTLSFIGWSTQSAVARGGGTRGQKRLDYEQSLIFRLSHGDREHVTLRVKGEERWRKPEWRKKFLSPAPSLLLFTINLHNFTFSLAARGRKEGRPLARGQEEGGQNNLKPSHTGNLYPSSQVRINQEIDDRPRLSHEKRLVEECEIQGNKQQQKTQFCAPC